LYAHNLVLLKALIQWVEGGWGGDYNMMSTLCLQCSLFSRSETSGIVSGISKMFKGASITTTFEQWMAMSWWYTTLQLHSTF